MLLDLATLVEKWNLKITGVIHCGAQLGQEARDYYKMGITNVWWIEANPGIIPELTKNVKRYGHHVIEALLGERDGEEMVFNITNNQGMSSSIFEFGELHLKSSPETKFVRRIPLKTRTLDSLVVECDIEDCNLINADLQGAEYLAFSGANRTLMGVDYVYCEVNKDYVYQGIQLVDKLDELLCEFKRVETSWTPAKWGDALYIRKELL